MVLVIWYLLFHNIPGMVLKYEVSLSRAECTKPEQLVVTFVAGYIGILLNISWFFCVANLYQDYEVYSYEL